jgi:hypothetical protein
MKPAPPVRKQLSNSELLGICCSSYDSRPLAQEAPTAADGTLSQ